MNIQNTKESNKVLRARTQNDVTRIYKVPYQKRGGFRECTDYIVK